MSGRSAVQTTRTPQVGDPAAGRRQVPDLEYRHVPAVTATPLEVPAGGGVRLRRRHHLHERVAHLEHRVGQAELSHPRIVKGRRPAEDPAQLASHLAAVARDQGDLAQARSVRHTPTLRSWIRLNELDVDHLGPGDNPLTLARQRLPVPVRHELLDCLRRRELQELDLHRLPARAVAPGPLPDPAAVPGGDAEDLVLVGEQAVLGARPGPQQYAHRHGTGPRHGFLHAPMMPGQHRKPGRLRARA